MTTEEIDKRASQMTDSEREQYITACGWAFIGAGWFPPAGFEDQRMGGMIRHSPSGIYSLSTAIREQFAREDPDAKPNHLGRYYHGTVEHDPNPDPGEPVITTS